MILVDTHVLVWLALDFGSDYPRDRADQIIGATARAHALPLVTADQRLQASPLLNCVW
jgi:PIN domain nuclease of toxin-antitoxin system